MSLSSQQFEQLSEVLVTKFDDKGVELDQVVKFNLGTGLFVDYAGHGSPFRIVVHQLLQKTEKRGSTAKLFAGVIRFRPDIRDAVAHILPEAAEAAPVTARHVADVLEGVREVQARLDIDAVRERILHSSGDLQRVVIDLDLLARYKALHDCLHNLQLKHYRVVASAARRLKEDPSAKDTLGEYLHQIRIQCSNARTAALGLPNTPGERDVEMEWISALETLNRELHAALIYEDDRAAVKSAYGLKRILRTRPRDLDQLLITTARRVPLSKLVDSLQDVAAAAAAIGGDARSPHLTSAILALQRLIPDQMGLIAEHTAWQQVDNEFWQADTALHTGSPESLEEFQYVWESLWGKMLMIIASNPAATWAVSLDQQGKEFIIGFPMPAMPPVPGSVKAHFNMLQRDAMFQFFEVDKSLHDQCTEIIKIGEPIQSLLKEASSVHH
jgi:hypothetical protein